jgi:hypothetical protein
LKRFIRDASIFIAGLLVMNALVFLVVDPLGRDDGYLARVEDAPAGSRGIVLADSHGTRLDDEALRAAGIANMSAGSDSYGDMLNKLVYAAERYPLKLVVVTADGHCMSKYREFTNNGEKSALLVGGSGLKAAARRYFPIVDPKRRDLFKGSLSASVGRLVSRRKAAEVAAPSLQWKDKPNRRELSMRRAGTQFTFSEPSKVLRGTLLEIAAFCEARGIALVGLKYPLSGDYLDAIGGKDYGAAETLDEAGVPVLDHETLYRSRDELFEDQDHLNQEGGAAFTRLLIDELRAGGNL